MKFEVGDIVLHQGKEKEVTFIDEHVNDYPIFVSRKNSAIAGGASPEEIEIIRCRSCDNRLLYSDERKERFCPFCDIK